MSRRLGERLIAAGEITILVYDRSSKLIGRIPAEIWKDFIAPGTSSSFRAAIPYVSRVPALKFEVQRQALIR